MDFYMQKELADFVIALWNFHEILLNHQILLNMKLKKAIKIMNTHGYVNCASNKYMSHIQLQFVILILILLILLSKLGVLHIRNKFI
jgi:hypothetical protein